MKIRNECTSNSGGGSFIGMLREAFNKANRIFTLPFAIIFCVLAFVFPIPFIAISSFVVYKILMDVFMIGHLFSLCLSCFLVLLFSACGYTVP